MDIITRSEAKSQGLKTYFDGKPCRNGHLSPKRVDNYGCVECGKIKTAVWSRRDWNDNYEKNIIKSRKYANATKQNNPEALLLSGAKRRAKQKGLEFNITHEDIQIPDTCPVLGIPIIRGVGRQTDNSPSIDRIDNSKGYIKGNVRVVSWRINQRKSDMSVTEILALADYIKRELTDYCPINASSGSVQDELIVCPKRDDEAT